LSLEQINLLEGQIDALEVKRHELERERLAAVNRLGDMFDCPIVVNRDTTGANLDKTIDEVDKVRNLGELRERARADAFKADAEAQVARADRLAVEIVDLERKQGADGWKRSYIEVREQLGLVSGQSTKGAIEALQAKASDHMQELSDASGAVGTINAIKPLLGVNHWHEIVLAVKELIHTRKMRYDENEGYRKDISIARASEHKALIKSGNRRIEIEEKDQYIGELEGELERYKGLYRSHALDKKIVSLTAQRDDANQWLEKIANVVGIGFRSSNNQMIYNAAVGLKDGKLTDALVAARKAANIPDRERLTELYGELAAVQYRMREGGNELAMAMGELADIARHVILACGGSKPGGSDD